MIDWLNTPINIDITPIKCLIVLGFMAVYITIVLIVGEWDERRQISKERRQRGKE